jgi:ribosomal protein L11 methyltransferase
MAGRPYDLICANILARPLCHMAGDAAKALDRNGTIILSGLLTRDAMRVIARYRAHGFRLVHAIVIDGWQALVMKLG